MVDVSEAEGRALFEKAHSLIASKGPFGAVKSVEKIGKGARSTAISAAIFALLCVYYIYNDPISPYAWAGVLIAPIAAFFFFKVYRSAYADLAALTVVIKNDDDLWNRYSKSREIAAEQARKDEIGQLRNKLGRTLSRAADARKYHRYDAATRLESEARVIESKLRELGA